jgi:hypothetical protein
MERMMTKRGILAMALLAMGSAAAGGATPAAAQGAGHVSIEPYVGYGFYGNLPRESGKLEAAVAYGGQASLQLTPQFALYGNYQRSKPEVEGGAFQRSATVDHWSTGLEFSYVPRGGAEGMFPVILQAGVGQARYDFTDANIIGSFPKFQDTAVNLGLASALRLSPRLGIRYGVNDYISNFRKDMGVTNQFFVNVGAELRF